MQQNNPNQKDPDNRGLDDENTISEQFRTLWCSIKDDYRTLAELEGVSVVNLYTDIEEEDEADERSAFLSTI
jgi:hypothetical protein